MCVRKGWTWLLAVVLLLGGLPLTAAAGPAPAAPIEPALLRLLETGETANFFVEMSVQADLAAVTAAAGPDWQSRGRAVWQALTWVAQASQAPALAYARWHGLEAQSLAAANTVYIRGGTLRAARDLAALPGVARLRLERFRELVPTPEAATEGATSWGLIDAKAPDVWALGVRGAGAWLANIDTGVQWDHPALVGNYGCPDDPGNPRCWWDPSNVCGGVPCDNNGHGTHIMGTMVAEDDPGLPYTAGMAPDTAWIACKGCESASCSDFSLLSCGDWVLAPGGDPGNRPHIVNNSWGGQGGDNWYRAVVMAWVYAGIFPAFAAGGSGPSCATLGSPCDYPESFCVAAHDQYRNPASFSSRGPGAFGDAPYTKPNISAPGVAIWSTVPTDSWAQYSGTSTASPHAAGAAALVVSGCPELAYDVYGLFEILQDNADPPPPGYCGAPPGGEGNYTFGYGYLNALAAVEACHAQGSLHLNKLKANGRVAPSGLFKLVALLRIHDQDHLPAAGVTVSGEWTAPDGLAEPAEAVTEVTGVAKMRLKSALPGEYRFCLIGLAAPGYAYDAGANEDAMCKTAVVGP